MMLPDGAVGVTGELHYFAQQSDGGNTVRRGFCPACGSPVLSRNDGYPENVYVLAATLDDPSVFRPTAVVFRDSAQPWDVMDPSLD